MPKVIQPIRRQPGTDAQLLADRLDGVWDSTPHGCMALEICPYGNDPRCRIPTQTHSSSRVDIPKSHCATISRFRSTVAEQPAIPLSDQPCQVRVVDVVDTP